MDGGGIDGRDGTAFQIVNAYPNDYANAYFLPPPFGPQETGVLVYGQDDRVPYVSVDVVAHEYQHGVTHYGVLRRTGEGLSGGYTRTTARTDVVQGYGSDGSRYRVRVPCGRPFFFLPVESDSWWYRRPVFYLCAEDRRLPLLVTREAAAVHEALSDVIATAVEYSVHSPNQGNLRGDWQIGEDLGEVWRDLQNPSRLRLDTDDRAPQYPHRFPSVYSALVRFVPLFYRADNREWVWTYSSIISQDDGRSLSYGPSFRYPGQHWNSTILSHAFYRAVAGGCHSVTQVCVSHSDAAQYSRDDVAGVFLRAVTRFIQADSTLPDVGQAVRQAARDLADPRGALIRGIDRALTGVGL